jgi:pyruvate dehydrogenase E1 component
VLGDQGGPVIAVTDYMRAVPDQVSRFVERRFVSLGTDGFGRSDTREALRSYFEVDAAHVVLAVLAALADAGEGKPDDVADAISRYGLETERPDPWTL